MQCNNSPFPFIFIYKVQFRRFYSKWKYSQSMLVLDAHKECLSELERKDVKYTIS